MTLVNTEEYFYSSIQHLESEAVFTKSLLIKDTQTANQIIWSANTKARLTFDMSRYRQLKNIKNFNQG